MTVAPSAGREARFNPVQCVREERKTAQLVMETLRGWRNI